MTRYRITRLFLYGWDETIHGDEGEAITFDNLPECKLELEECDRHSSDDFRVEYDSGDGWLPLDAEACDECRANGPGSCDCYQGEL